MSAKTMTETTPFEHKVTPRHTEFRMAPELTESRSRTSTPHSSTMPAQRDDRQRHRARHRIGTLPTAPDRPDRASPVFRAKLAGVAKHVFVLKGGMGKKQRRETAAALAAVPENESRVILATGSYIGEGFDDARLDTLFLAMPISWKGTLCRHKIPAELPVLPIRAAVCLGGDAVGTL
jgi:hypothetical protein